MQLLFRQSAEYPNVITLVPSKRLYLFDIKIPNFLYLGGSSINWDDYPQRVYNEGMCFMGQMVQLSERDFFDTYPASQEIRDVIKSKMDKVGYSFGMYLPHWQNPKIVSRHGDIDYK